MIVLRDGQFRSFRVNYDYDDGSVNDLDDNDDRLGRWRWNKVPWL